MQILHSRTKQSDRISTETQARVCDSHLASVLSAIARGNEQAAGRHARQAVSYSQHATGTRIYAGYRVTRKQAHERARVEILGVEPRDEETLTQAA